MEFCNSDERILSVSDDKTQSQFLSDVSPNDKPWDSHKKDNGNVSAILKGSDKKSHQKLGKRIDECSQNLEFGWVLVPNGTGEVKLRLKYAQFCRGRPCPICQWRRALMWVSRFFDAFPRIYAAHPEMRYIMLTLTVRNCSISELKAVVSNMSSAWQRLSQRKDFPALGFVRSLEVTRGKDGSCHPHFHVLLAVPPSYFSRNYLSKDKWAVFWLESLRLDKTFDVLVDVSEPLENTVLTSDFDLRLQKALDSGLTRKQFLEAELNRTEHETKKQKRIKPKSPTNWARDWFGLLSEQERILNASNPDRKKYLKNKYLPVCDVRIVKEKPKKGQVVEGLQSESTPDPMKALMSAITETIKYTTKPSDMVKEKAWLLEMVDQMQNVRAIALGGIFKKFLKETETEQDLITASETDIEKAVTNEGGFMFGWRSRLKRYVYAGKKQKEEPEGVRTSAAFFILFSFGKNYINHPVRHFAVLKPLSQRDAIRDFLNS
jgi:plasmid rolling circle replication initiator protein Rep